LTYHREQRPSLRRPDEKETPIRPPKQPVLKIRERAVKHSQIVGGVRENSLRVQGSPFAWIQTSLTPEPHEVPLAEGDRGRRRLRRLGRMRVQWPSEHRASRADGPASVRRVASFFFLVVTTSQEPRSSVEGKPSPRLPLALMLEERS
jgi:hypothetical protein